MRILQLLICLWFVIFNIISASDGLYLHSNWGYNYSFDSVLSVNTNDGDMVHKAKWEGKSFKDSPYYTIRLDRWANESTFGIEWVHYKMYLKNPPAGIENLSVSDGYNILFFNVGRRTTNDFIMRIGGGIIVAHPDVTLTGKERFWNKGGISGAYISGLALQLSLERWFYQTKRYVFSSEIKFSTGYARIPISKNSNEFGDIPHVAFHITIGMGSKPLTKKASILDYAYYFIVPTIHHYTIYRFDDFE